MQHIVKRLKEQNVKTLHISFDIDGMDPSIVAATGTKVKKGLFQNDFEEFVSALSTLSSCNIALRVLDFVEYNPKLDTDEKTIKWCKSALEALTSVLHQK